MIYGVRPLLWRPHCRGWAPLPWESERAESFSTGETKNLRIAGLGSGFHTEKLQPREGSHFSKVTQEHMA